MTNKLPEVGKRYKLRDEISQDVKVLMIWENSVWYVNEMWANPEQCRIGNFFERFEELPEENTAAPLKVEISAESTGSATIGSGLSDVEKAKEELDRELDCWLPREDQDEFQLVSKAQSLLDALDAEKNCKKHGKKLINDRDCVGCVQERTVKNFEIDFLKAVDVDLNKEKESQEWMKGCMEDRKVCGGCECSPCCCKAEPKNIWRDVSELERTAGEHDPILTKNRFGEIALTKRDEVIDDFEAKERGWSFHKEFCTLTDYINSIEELKERVAKLEKK